MKWGLHFIKPMKKALLIIIMLICLTTLSWSQQLEIGGIIGTSDGIDKYSIIKRELANGAKIPSQYQESSNNALALGITCTYETNKWKYTIGMRLITSRFSFSYDNFKDTNIVRAITAFEYETNTTEIPFEIGKKIKIPNIGNFTPFIGISLNINNLYSYGSRRLVTIKYNDTIGVGNSDLGDFGSSFIGFGSLCGMKIQPTNRFLSRFELMSYINFQFNGGLPITQYSYLQNVTRNNYEEYKNSFTIRPIYIVIALKYNFYVKTIKGKKTLNNY